MEPTHETTERGGGAALAVGAFLCGALTGAVLATLFAPARGRETRERLRAAAREGRHRASEAGARIVEAGRDAGSAVRERKDVYLRKLEKELESWSATIDALADKAQHATADMRVEYEKQVADLRVRWDRTRGALDELRAAGQAAWQDLAASADRARQELKRAVESAASKVR